MLVDGKKKTKKYEDKKITETFNKFFGRKHNKNVEILFNSEVLENVSMIKVPIIDAVEKN